MPAHAVTVRSNTVLRLRNLDLDQTISMAPLLVFFSVPVSSAYDVILVSKRVVFFVGCQSRDRTFPACQARGGS